MRAVFWILLAANATLFAVMHWGGLLAADEQAGQTQPALHEEQIRLLADTPQTVPAAALPASAPVAARPDKLACLEWGEFAGADLTRATAALTALQIGDKLSQRQVEHTIGYWVYIPPLADKTALNQKIVQLKARGIKEYFIVQEAGQWLNAISLGVFKTQEAAQKFRDELRARGIRSAQNGERASKLKMTIFGLNGVDDAIGARLAAMQKDFAGSELKNVPCTLTR
jgi:hypothetical protein